MIRLESAAATAMLALACILTSPTSFAVPVSATFSGALEFRVPSRAPLDSAVPFTFTLNYDDSAEGTTPVSPDEVRYHDIFTGQFALGESSAQIARALVVLSNDTPFGLTFNSMDIGAANSPFVPAGGDYLFIEATLDRALDVDGRTVDGIQLLLIDNEGSALLSGSGLPSQFPAVSALEFAQIHASSFDAVLGAVSFFDGIDGPVSTIAPSAVPLPPAALLLVSALPLLRLRRSARHVPPTGWTRS